MSEVLLPEELLPSSKDEPMVEVKDENEEKPDVHMNGTNGMNGEASLFDDDPKHVSGPELEELSIAGLRSYAPLEINGKEQKIKFTKPITLILGPNGAGKTTVIEALRFLCCGDMPPGAGPTSFIYDVMLASEKNKVEDVRGVAKLKFRDVSGKQKFLYRQLHSTLGYNRQGIRAATGGRSESAICTIDPKTGEQTDKSTRVDDITREVQEDLGVSKAVLTNVLFCHQEDSFWPLQEGKQLKEKFDLIFATSQYVKTLDDLRTAKKRLSDNAKWLEQCSAKSKKLFEEAKNLNSEKSEKEKALVTLETDMKIIEEELTPLVERTDQLKEALKDVKPAAQKLREIAIRKTTAENTITDMKSHIKEEYQGTLEELENELKQLTTGKEEKKKTILSTQNKKMNCELSIQKLRRKETELSNKRIRQLALEETHKADIDSRATCLTKLGQTPAGNFYSEDVDEREQAYRNFTQQLEEQEKEKMKEIFDLKEEMEVKMEEIQKQLRSKEAERAEIDGDIRRCNKSIKDSTRTTYDLEHALALASTDAARKVQLETDLESKQTEVAELQSKYNEIEMKSRLETMKLERKSVVERRERAEGALELLRNTHGLTKRLEAAEHSLKEREMVIIQKLSEHRSALAQSGLIEENCDFSTVDAGELKFKLVRKLGDAEKKVERLQKDQKRLNNDQVSLKEQTKMLQKRISEQEAQVKRHTLRLEADAEGVDVTALECTIKEIDDKLKNLRDEQGVLTGQTTLYSKYIKELSEKPNCPLCERGFNDSNEAESRSKLISTLKSSLALTPVTLERIEQEIRDAEAQRSRLLQLLPIGKELENIKREKKEKEDRLSTDLLRLDDRTARMSEMSKELDEVASLLKLLKAANNDVAIAASHEDDVSKLRDEVEDLRNKLRDAKISSDGSPSGTPTQTTFEDKQSQIGTLKEEEEQLAANIEELEKELNTYESENKLLSSELSHMQKSLIKLQDQLKTREQKEAKKKDLEKEIKDCEARKRDAEEKLPALDEKISILTQQLKALEREKEQKVEELRSRNREIESVREKILEYTKKIEAFISRYGRSAVQAIDDEVQTLRKDIETKDSELGILRSEVEKKSNELKNEEIVRRNLDDNRKLRVATKDLEELTQLEVVNTAIVGDVKVEELDAEYEEKYTKRRELEIKKANMAGQERETSISLKRLNGRLNQPAYLSAESDYTSEFAELIITKRSISDIDAFYKAVDAGILKFHQSKMEEVNDISRDLWTNVYRGNDIDYVAVESEEDSIGISSGRRQYNYRVVMYKNGVPMAMRGRCSAGQKVLACLIIRLALAEAFCTRCGILALDEPTTNLDFDNMIKLAEALSRLVKAREALGHNNSQLVVITHDEDFLFELNSERFVSNYFLVDRDENGCSRLRERFFGDDKMVQGRV